MTGRFRRGRTVVGTGVSFAIFMIWGFFLGVILFPAIRLFKGARARAIFHRHVRHAWKAFICIMKWTGGFKSISVTGLENLSPSRPVLLIGNHLTLVDIVILGAHVPNFNCVVKLGLWNHPFFGAVVKACDFIPNVASEAFLDNCRTGFAQNRPLIVFPQGERIPADQPIQFQRGAAQIAVRTGVMVQPVVIRCTPLTLAKGMPWYKVPADPVLTMEIHPPLPLPKDYDENAPVPKKVRQLTRYWEAYFENELTRG